MSQPPSRAAALPNAAAWYREQSKVSGDQASKIRGALLRRGATVDEKTRTLNETQAEFMEGQSAKFGQWADAITEASAIIDQATDRAGWQGMEIWMHDSGSWKHIQPDDIESEWINLGWKKAQIKLPPSAPSPTKV